LNEEEVKKKIQILLDIAKGLDLTPMDATHTINSRSEIVTAGNHIPIPPFWEITLIFRAEIKKVE
jgi:hypothetical protein